MHDAQCWPALQDGQKDETELPPTTECADLVPYVEHMVNRQADTTGHRILQVADVKPMTWETIDRVANGHSIFRTVRTNTKWGSVRSRQPIRHDGKKYEPGKGYYMSPRYEYDDNMVMQPTSPLHEYLYADDGSPLIPNGKPFAADPLTGSVRVLNCSAEAQYTQGVYLMQITMDRNTAGEEFIGISILMEVR